jgi:hypothetical protein
VQVGREQRGLVTTSPGTDFNDAGTLVERIVRDEQRFRLLLELVDRRR